jgi:hypothetical protein
VPTLADLLRAPPAADVRLLQAKVVGVTSGSATIRFGGADTTENISGIPYLTGGLAVDDIVWVLRSGGTLIIIGKLAATNEDTITGPYISRGSIGGFFTDERDDPTQRWGMYATTDKLRFWDGADRVTIDRGTGSLLAGNARMRTWPGDAAYSDFSDNRRGVAVGDYSFLSSSDGATFVNAKSTKEIYFRIANNTTNAMRVSAARSLHGSYGGGTLAEAHGEGTLYNGGAGNPNYIVKGGTFIIFFSGGNAHYSFTTAFPNVVNSVVVSHGDALGWMFSTTNWTKTGFGIAACFRDGSLANGNLRVNWMALGA